MVLGIPGRWEKIMECPCCSRTLTEIPQADWTVEACSGGCGGVWFDRFELARIDEAGEAVGPALLNVAIDPQVVSGIDFSERRRCPHCKMIMMRHKFNPGVDVDVDTCPGCAGAWLDGGELEKIRAVPGDEEERKQAANRHFNRLFWQLGEHGDG